MPRTHAKDAGIIDYYDDTRKRKGLYTPHYLKLFQGVEKGMKINPINSAVNGILPGTGVKNTKKAATGNVIPKDIYMPAGKGTKKMITYKRPVPAGIDREKIESLKAESERVYGHLRRLVEKLLKEQGRKYNLALSKYDDDDEMVPVTDEMRLEARALIADGGELCAEKVSDRIVDFAKAISGGDKEKLNTLKGAIVKGFKEAERILGGLPDISKNTYDLVMQKLDAWEGE